ncbi:hypothetical protein BN1708_009177 [Verticillium longisporum]|uniref:Large ribosomal subunit protein mL59 domain-containing protein n=2 Tax=Verticillium longisporum TaxID=100787 RepID=A0A0G4KDR5_VERLO|nr:hypothetical protein BN1708_009177 [Verticillium longisporum]
MAASQPYAQLAKALPARLQRFIARYPAPSILPAGATPETFKTGYQEASANPFSRQKHPVTGVWHEPVYSLRRQAELVKLAREHGVEELLPPTVKGSEYQLAHRVEHGLRVKGCNGSRQFDGRAGLLRGGYGLLLVRVHDALLEVLLLLRFLLLVLLDRLGNDVLVVQAVPSLDESHNGGLARARRTNDGRVKTLLDAQVQTVEDLDVRAARRGRGLALAACVVDPAIVARGDALLGATGRQHADGAKGLAGDGGGPGLGLGNGGLALDEEGQDDAEDEDEEQEDGGGDEGQLPAPGESDNDGREDGSVDIGGRGDGAGGGARGHGVEDVDRLAKEALDVVQSDGGGEADADQAEAKLVDVGQGQAADEEGHDVEGLLVEQSLKFRPAGGRGHGKVAGELADELAKDDIHQGQGGAGADGGDGGEDVDDDIPFRGIRKDSNVVFEGRFAFRSKLGVLGLFVRGGGDTGLAAGLGEGSLRLDVGHGGWRDEQEERDEKGAQ